MFRRTIHLDLPCQVAVYFVLFCTAAVAWLAVSVVVISQSAIRSSTEDRCLTQLDSASANVTRDLPQNGQANLQPLVGRFQSENSLAFCAIVSGDGRYLAHSSRELIGQVHAEPEGEYAQRGDAERIRYSDSDSGKMLGYRVPLQLGDDRVGTLHMAVREPSMWTDLGSASSYMLVAFVGPLLCLVLGARVLRRLVRPLAEVETELNRVASALSPAEVDLRELKYRTPVALGWNRLVEQHERDRSDSGLDQRLSEAMGQLRQQQADEIFNSIPDGLAVSDEQGQITFANQAMAAIAGNGTDGCIPSGSTMQIYLNLQNQAESHRPLLDPNLRQRTVVAEIDRSNNGAHHVFRVARHPLRAADGKSSSGHVWSVRDISQQKLVEQARDQFLDAATHELRTPLANIKAYAETLTLSEQLEVEQQKDFCNTINSEATRLARIVDELLSISSMEVGSLSTSEEETDMERLLSEVVQKVEPQAKQKKIDLRTSFPEKWPTLYVDKDKMAAALVNLLGNAVKYTPSDGQITLTVAAVGDALQIVVADTGVGISAVEQSKVFDKFFRSSDPRIQKESGSGLGLSFVQEVVRMHDGTVNVESEPDAGTTFTVTLPRKQEAHHV